MQLITFSKSKYMATNHNLLSTLELPTLSKDQMLMRNFFPPQMKWFSKSVNSIHKARPSLAYKMTMAALSFSGRRPLKAKDKDFYAQGTKQTFVSKNKTYYTYSYGKGPEVYFVHGWVSYGGRWKLYVDQVVARGFKAVVIDAPAHGTSPGMFLSLPDYVLALKHVFNNANNLHAVINHSIGSLCSIVALKECIVSKPCKIGLLSSFNTAEALLNKFGRSIGINEQVLTHIVPWIPRYAGYDISYLTISKHLEELGKDVLMIYDEEDSIVPAKEPVTLLKEHPNIRYYQTVGFGHNLKNPQIIEEVVNFITR